jgi:hypothetical protein
MARLDPLRTSFSSLCFPNLTRLNYRRGISWPLTLALGLLAARPLLALPIHRHGCPQLRDDSTQDRG